MVTRTSVVAPVKLAVRFVLLAAVPLVALGWVGRRLLEQDRALEAQRARQQLENAAALVANEIDRSLTSWEDLLANAAQGRSVRPPADSVLLVFDHRRLVRREGVALPYYPALVAHPELTPAVFAAGEAQELRVGGDLAKAESIYVSLTSSSDRRVRAASLMRLARCLRKEHRLKEALATYEALSAMGDTDVADAPAELVARYERVRLLNTLGDSEASAREASVLASALANGQFRIDRATFDVYSNSLAQPPAGAVVLADAAEQFWPLWQQQAAGRLGWTQDGRALVVVWRTMPAGSAAIVAPLEALLGSAQSALQNLHVQFTLDDPSGPTMASAAASEVSAERTSGETGLPWTIRVAASDPTATDQTLRSRQRLFVAGFWLVVLVIAAASYVAFRSVSRELGVARIQSDFVSAVSHGFRTPLTAMCHLSEMLEAGETPADRLPDYYRALGKEARRLHGLVESLLDFGRIEAGGREFQMEDTDVGSLVARLIDEFREHANAHQLVFTTPLDVGVRVRADGDALGLALRNLLDNAVKYSPSASTVTVSLGHRDGLVGIAVADQGAGMPASEQRDVFRKFVRGSAAKALNVKGTGIGLTIADRIAKAHGGRLEVVTAVGRGSCFTMWLPERP